MAHTGILIVAVLALGAAVLCLRVILMGVVGALTAWKPLPGPALPPARIEDGRAFGRPRRRLDGVQLACALLQIVIGFLGALPAGIVFLVALFTLA